jgi:hypothetical protein
MHYVIGHSVATHTLNFHNIEEQKLFMALFEACEIEGARKECGSNTLKERNILL